MKPLIKPSERIRRRQELRRWGKSEWKVTLVEPRDPSQFSGRDWVIGIALCLASVVGWWLVQ